jgi:hypothetical protein
MRTYFRIMLLVFIMAAVAAGNSSVSAQACTIQSSSLAYTSPQYNSGSSVLVPVSVRCPFVGGQLYAVGSAVDASNAPMGSGSVVRLSSAYGTNIYTGQLSFSISPGVTEYTWRVTISIYSGLYYGYGSTLVTGSPLATSVETVQIHPNNYANYASCYYTNSCLPSIQTQVYNSCHSPSSNGTVQCVGYLYQNPNSCVELVIPIYPVAGEVSYQYLTLQSLPSSYPAIGTWVTVNGQPHLGPNFSSTGAACPGNYLNVTSITS